MNKNDYKKQLKKLFLLWEWEWFASFNFNENQFNVSIDHTYKMLKDWIIPLCKEEKIQIAYMGLFVNYPMPHIHLLLYGINRYGKTLNNVDKHLWEGKWRGDASIKNVDYNEGVIQYITERNTYNNNFELIQPYNNKLLKKRQRI